MVSPFAIRGEEVTIQASQGSSEMLVSAKIDQANRLDIGQEQHAPRCN